MDTLSLAPSSAYQGFNKTKKHVKNKKQIKALPEAVR